MFEREAGVGLKGRFRLGRPASLAYEAYLVNGFRLLDENGALAAPKGAGKG